MIKNHFSKFIFSTILLLPSSRASAALLDGIDCIETGDCSLNNIVQVGVNATQILLGLSGSVALLFFIYGGVTFLISGGSAEKVTKGKTIITNAIIGLVLIFISFTIIQFSMEALGYTKSELWYVSK